MVTRKSKRNDNAVSPINSGTEEEPMSTDLSQYVTTKQAAEMLGVAQDHINHLLLSGKLRGIKPGGWGWLVYKPSIEQYEKSRSPQGRPRSRESQTQETK